MSAASLAHSSASRPSVAKQLTDPHRRQPRRVSRSAFASICTPAFIARWTLRCVLQYHWLVMLLNTSVNGWMRYLYVLAYFQSFGVLFYWSQQDDVQGDKDITGEANTDDDDSPQADNTACFSARESILPTTHDIQQIFNRVSEKRRVQEKREWLLWRVKNCRCPRKQEIYSNHECNKSNWSKECRKNAASSCALIIPFNEAQKSEWIYCFGKFKFLCWRVVFTVNTTASLSTQRQSSPGTARLALHYMNDL